MLSLDAYISQQEER
ncbi:hypothetical protein CP8484711_0974A, partial [Chlamydia psittaci 84-8471/1]